MKEGAPIDPRDTLPRRVNRYLDLGALAHNPELSEERQNDMRDKQVFLFQELREHPEEMEALLGYLKIQAGAVEEPRQP